MKKNNFLAKQQIAQKVSLEIGIQCGRQQILDMMSLALREPEIMGKDIFGRDRLLKVVDKIRENIDYYQPAFEKQDETDYYRAKLDEALVDAYGGELHDSFEKRYEFCPTYDYSKGKWK